MEVVVSSVGVRLKGGGINIEKIEGVGSGGLPQKKILR